MKKIVYVNSGEVKFGNSNIILNSGAIGSCIVVTAYYAKNRIGAMAHILLPGTAPLPKNTDSEIHQSRYAFNAISQLLEWFKSQQINYDELETCLIGGANVLKRKNDKIGKDNYKSITNILEKLNIKISAKTIGGDERRTTVFDIEHGNVNFTEGGSKEKILWKSSY